MFTGQAAVFSNREDWKFTPYSLVDDETGDLIDLTSASIEVGVTYQDGCSLLTGSLDDGTVFLVEDDAFQIIFARSRITSICAGTYELGITVTNVDETVSLIAGTIAVLDGGVPA